MRRTAGLAVVVMIFVTMTSSGDVSGQPPLERTKDGRVFLYYSLDPLVVYKGDDATLMTLEVATTGLGVDSVRLVGPHELELLDDESGGDRVAGDGIYTSDRVEHRTQYGQLAFGGTHATSGRLHVVIDLADGGQEEYWLGCGVVAPNQRFWAAKKGEGLYATSHAFFIEDPAGDLLDTQDWPLGFVHCGQSQFGVFEKLYSVYPDVFDFVIVMPAHPIYDPDRNFAENVPYFVHAKNEIQNIGLDIYDNTPRFFSQGRLMGMIYHSWGPGSILDHEIGHAWAANLGRVYDLAYCDDCYGPHWNPLTDIAGQMSAFLFHPDAPIGAGHLLDNGDGTWRIDREPGDNTPYSDLDLYAMGLIPASEVGPISTLVDPDTTDAGRVTCTTIETTTIDDIIAAEGGERVPDFADSPKEFSIAMVVVKNAEFTPAEFAFYSLVAKYFASTEQGDWSLTTFHQATGGRATLNPLLPVAPRSAGGRVSPAP